MIKHENNYCFNSCIDIERTTFNVYHHDTRGQSLYCLYHPDDEKLVARIRVIPKVKRYVVSGMDRRTGEKTYLKVTRDGHRWSSDALARKLNAIDDATIIANKRDAENLLKIVWNRSEGQSMWVGDFAVEEVWVKP